MIGLAGGLLLGVVVAQADTMTKGVVAIDQLVITESAAGLTATLNGVAVALTLSGTTDHWSVDLPSGYSFSLTGPIILGEFGDPNSKDNVSAFTTGGHFTWESDIGAPATTAPTTVTIMGAGTDPFHNTFDLILTDAGDDPPAPTDPSAVAQVPDGGSTAALLGLAFVGIATHKMVRLRARA